MKEDGRFKKGLTPWNKGIKMVYKSGKHPIEGTIPSPETKAKQRLAKLGKKLSEEHKAKMSASHKGKVRSKEHQMKLNDSNRGEKSRWWKGGISPANKVIRRSVEYKCWREAVFLRDNWTCKKCKIRGLCLHPHHILNFCQWPDLRFDVDNGITLCKSCHTSFHKKYGKVGNTREQILEYTT